MLKFTGEITDPIHRHIQFTEIEREIIDTPAFQRLRRIRQLAGAHLVYPSAQHSRFEHSIGVMHIAGIVGQTLIAKGYIEDEQAIQELRLAALLHDIGHGPFSHLFEEVLRVNSKITHEEMGRRIILGTEISDVLSKHGVAPAYLCRLSFGQSEVRFMNEIIAGGLASDLMDYLPRDGYFTGTEYGKIDQFRLIGSFEVVSKNRLAINRSSLNSLESMLISRYQMFKAVYFHKTVRSGEVMLLHSMMLADKEFGLTDTSVKNYVELTDECTLDRLIYSSTVKSHDLSLSRKLATDYRNRRLLKCVYEKFLQGRERSYTKSNTRSLQLLEDNITSMAGAKPGNVFVDASRAPSMPLTPTKNEMSSVMLVDKKEGEYELPISDLPLIDSISGFFDMLRVYTTARDREKVQGAVRKILGDRGAIYL